MLLRRIPWRVVVGVVIIGAVLGGLWVTYRPTLPWEQPGVEKVQVPLLHGTGVGVTITAPSGRVQTSQIGCEGRDRTADGFWAPNPARACDAVASTRAALLAGHGCRRLDQTRIRMEVRGQVSGTPVRLRQQQGGCPDPDGWLKVNALAVPAVQVAEREATDRGGG